MIDKTSVLDSIKAPNLSITDAIVENKKNPLLSFQTFMQVPEKKEEGLPKPPLLTPIELAKATNIRKEGINKTTLLEESPQGKQTFSQLDQTRHDNAEVLVEGNEDIEQVQLVSENLEEKIDLASATKNYDVLRSLLQYVAEGQDQVDGVKKQLSELGKSSEAMNPGKLMQMQLEMSTALQRIEYASIVLSNAVSSLKSIFNNPL